MYPIGVGILAGWVFAIIVCWRAWNWSGLGPLQRAAKEGDLTAAISLFKQGDDVNGKCAFKRWTALHAAAAFGQVKMAKLLLEHGASVSVRADDGHTPLIETAAGTGRGASKSTESGRNAVALLLLLHGADVNAQGVTGDTALHIAAFENNVQLVKLLLDHNADPNLAQGQGMTPLHRAADIGPDRAQIARLLLEHGADLSKRDIYGNTPLDDAMKYNPPVAAVIRNYLRSNEKVRSSESKK